MPTLNADIAIFLAGGGSNQVSVKALTDEARRLIRSHKRELLAALADEARIRGWLRTIGEDDGATVHEILERARTDPKALAYYLERAAERERPELYERVLGNTALSFATLEPEEIAEAARIGLLPAGIAKGVVVLAYRTGGAQGLLTIPKDRYDGLRVLEIFHAAGG